MGRAQVALLVASAALALTGCEALSGLDSLTLDECTDGCDDGGADDASIDAVSGPAAPHQPLGDAAQASNDGGGTGDDTGGGGGPTGNDASDHDVATSDTGAPDAGVDAACPGTGGPTAVRVGGFCIDTTEVTNTQYAAFLSATNNGSTTTGQPSYCSWNTSYVPSNDWPNSNGNDPVGYVDWCDAYMFCQWAGKRLCGAIGGGPTPFNSYANAGVSQWYSACSKNGTLAYPYGNSFDNSKCNGNVPQGKVAPVASFTGCVGGYPGLFDLSGNVWEWEDSCQSTNGSNDTCRVRGGAADVPSSEMGCALDSTSVAPLSRNGRYFDMGFRCCGP